MFKTHSPAVRRPNPLERKPILKQKVLPKFDRGDQVETIYTGLSGQVFANIGTVVEICPWGATFIDPCWKTATVVVNTGTSDVPHYIHCRPSKVTRLSDGYSPKPMFD